VSKADELWDAIASETESRTQTYNLTPLMAGLRDYAKELEDERAMLLAERDALHRERDARPELMPAYIAHRLGAGPDREQNRLAAAKLVGWLARHYLIEPVCPWIVLASVWLETDRDLGLAIDRAAIERCGLMIAVGELPGLSPGMQAEASWAKRVVDLTGLCEIVARDLDQIDRRLGDAGVRRRVNG